MMKREQFGANFKWGVTISAFQNEGAASADGKGPSIWDTFTENIEQIKNNDRIGEASQFYTRYEDDIALARQLGLNTFRFSISWSRILPFGIGKINQSGIDYYNRVIDCCLSNGLMPFVTLYHWDLPQALEDKGGWTNRDIVEWFTNYIEICVTNFGKLVTNWIVMNEPMSFTGLGYFMGYHAPQRTGINTFLKAAHHTVLCMALGGAKIRELQPHANIGVALSCSYIQPVNQSPKNRRAAKRIEAMLNRFYLEPLLGLGYPFDVMPALSIIKSFFKDGDKQRMVFDFDFIGIQYYFRVVAKHSLTPPILFAKEIEPTTRKAKLNSMDLDVYPKGLYKLLKFYSRYPQIKELLITESGVCYPDYLVRDHVYDVRRTRYHQKMLKQVLKAQRKGININGYFIWTLVDNFEWREGFEPRFGLVHVDFETQKRTIKHSGRWLNAFLK
ncbi:beta-glucosidase [Carboxylicivirga mesophila]|uniref:Beta-glucosidase n=1 Tax=Carboxylicivirga mesophila TaxID=1166478 RepID=A0ABS5KDU8_9BACT|nr:GH1 family beta-glucosidase [Carboxylicivirga mesophila]MBS2213161.1 beta-glucosidase [Carboxylicivirga mesophila]